MLATINISKNNEEYVVSDNIHIMGNCSYKYLRHWVDTVQMRFENGLIDMPIPDYPVFKPITFRLTLDDDHAIEKIVSEDKVDDIEYYRYIVETVFNTQIQKGRKDTKSVRLRQWFIVLCYKYTTARLVDITSEVGLKHETTYYSIKSIKGFIETYDSATMKELEKLSSVLGAGLKEDILSVEFGKRYATRRSLKKTL